MLNEFGLNFKGELVRKRRVGKEEEWVETSQVSENDQVSEVM